MATSNGAEQNEEATQGDSARGPRVIQ